MTRAGDDAGRSDEEKRRHPAQVDPNDPSRFEESYRDERVVHGLPAATPWDIGGPQPVVRQLVALGAVKGEVLDPGTGPGHHAIYYASQGLSATGIDGSATAIERARENARQAGVSVDFQVADATKLYGLDDRFDTVVDSAFYHTFSTAPELQKSYMQALHRATRPGARLYMFAFGEHDVNGFKMLRSLPASAFRDVLPLGGWEITYLGPTTYQVNISPESIELSAARNPEMAEQAETMRQRYQAMEPWLTNGRVHAPFWEVHATRVD